MTSLEELPPERLCQCQCHPDLEFPCSSCLAVACRTVRLTRRNPE